MKAIMIDDNIESGLIFQEKFDKIIRNYELEIEVTVINDVENPILWEKPYDLYFVDLEMPKMGGLELFKKLQKINLTAKYICISSHDSYMHDAFFVNPMAFVRKDKMEEDLKDVFRCLANKVENEKVIELNDATRSVKVRPSEIMYCKSDGHYIELHCVKEKKIIRNNTQVIYNKLLHYKFIQSHRSYLVNLKYIESIKDLEIIMINGEVVPISRRMKQATMEIIVQWFSEKE